MTQPGSSGSFDQVEAPAPDACVPTDEPLAAVAAIATSLPDEAWFVHTVSAVMRIRYIYIYIRYTVYGIRYTVLITVYDYRQTMHMMYDI